MAPPSPRVSATPTALALIDRLRARHGALLFHQSGGCCDGSTPMCYPQSEFLVGDHDVCLGEIGGCPFYMGEAQYQVWQHSRLIIDAVPGRGGMFSLESGEGMRFHTLSVIDTPEGEVLQPCPLQAPSA